MDTMLSMTVGSAVWIVYTGRMYVAKVAVRKKMAEVVGKCMADVFRREKLLAVGLCYLTAGRAKYISFSQI